jgi:hypothetical protein
MILRYAKIMDIFNEDEITPLSQLYFQGAIKKELINAKTCTNQVKAIKEPINGLQ